jgi:hypothetical protein
LGSNESALSKKFRTRDAAGDATDSQMNQNSSKFGSEQFTYLRILLQCIEAKAAAL